MDNMSWTREYTMLLSLFCCAFKLPGWFRICRVHLFVSVWVDINITLVPHAGLLPLSVIGCAEESIHYPLPHLNISKDNSTIAQLGVHRSHAIHAWNTEVA
jgi:hypothetical protein